MIHEALFYLWNNTGELALINDPREWIDLVQLREFLHPGEKDLLQKVMKIALKSHKIEFFVNGILSSRGGDGCPKGSSEGGLYLKAFCNGIDQVLAAYKTEIVKIEAKFLENPQLSLSYALGCLEKFITLFNMLDCMVDLVKSEQVKGCLLVGRLHKFLNGADESMMKATCKIILSVNVTFYTQLSDWIVYGDFTDNYDEFFICNANKPNPEFLYLPQPTASKQSSELLLGKKSKIKLPPVVWHFYLKRDLLPTNIPLETAETILFMGTVLWIIQNEPKQAVSVEKYNFHKKRDVWEGKATEYYSKIKSLETKPFNLQAFNEVIEACRIKLTKYLWNLFVVEADLPGHLQTIRDYCCLGRGELFQQFIIMCEEYLKDVPNHYIVQNLNFIFTDTAQKMYSENYKLYQKFELSVVNDVSREKLWNLLEINFDIPWPLHVVFHPKAMCLYNKLFNFLLRLKKTHITLHKLWFLHMSGKKKVDSRVWTLRHQLMFLVNNLQYYFQVDAIEAQFSLLQEAIHNANAFEDIVALHNRFLTNLLSRTFIMNTSDHQCKSKHKLYQIPNLNYEVVNPVHECILDLLHVCEKFCLFASVWDVDLTEPDLEDLVKFEKESSTVVDRLMFILNSLRKKTSNKHLLQLLLQLNYNSWFCKQKLNFNLSAS